MRAVTAAIYLVALLVAAAPARGQGSPSAQGSGGTAVPPVETLVLADDQGNLLELRVLTHDEVDQLREWIGDAKDYQKWRVRWFNRYKKNMFGGPAERQLEPPPPEWMAEQCRVLASYAPRPAGPLREACDLQALIHTLKQEEPSALQARYVQARKEEDAHASFWDRVYFEGLWPMVNSSSTAFGLAGVHTGFWSLGRVSPFTLPGIMLVSLPDGNGGRIIKPAATFGLSVEWFDFNFMSRRTKVHFTIAKAFVASSSPTGGMTTVDLAGFSFTSGRER